MDTRDHIHLCAMLHGDIECWEKGTFFVRRVGQALTVPVSLAYSIIIAVTLLYLLSTRQFIVSG